MRIAMVAGVLLSLGLPAVGNAQASSSLSYRPNPTSAQLQAQFADAAQQDTVETNTDLYAVNNTVPYAAAIGGIIGGVAVAVDTMWDNDADPLSWGAAVAAPIVGGLIGAGVGYLIR